MWIIVDYCIVFISCSDSRSDGNHSLQRIHWWARDVMLNCTKSVLMKKQTHSTSWIAWEFQLIVIMWWIKSLRQAHYQTAGLQHKQKAICTFLLRQCWLHVCLLKECYVFMEAFIFCNACRLCMQREQWERWSIKELSSSGFCRQTSQHTEKCLSILSGPSVPIFHSGRITVLMLNIQPSIEHVSGV